MALMYALRTRFAKDIVAEFMPPSRAMKRVRVIIFCPGMPGNPERRSLLEFYSRKGFWVFAPRYRGSWESGGSFLRYSPEKDIKDVIDGLPRGFKDAFSGKKFKLEPDELYIFGGSFGGPAALLLSKDPRVKKVIACSPVADMRDLIRHGETWDWTYRFTREAFGEAYRFTDKDWAKQKNGKFYNPMTNLAKIDGSKAFIIHAKDDKVVPHGPTVKLAKLTGAKLWLLPRGGHCSSSWYMKPRFYAKIAAFLHSN